MPVIRLALSTSQTHEERKHIIRHIQTFCELSQRRTLLTAGSDRQQ